MGPEQARLERLEKQPAHSAETVAAVLPEAVAHSTANRADELSIALEPAMTTAVSAVARNNPDVFGEALAPTIGAAVRKAVRDAFAAMLQRLDEALERSMSIRSLAWRLEAKRTGRPLAEVVLLRTLVYRVEQVFLIHPGSGIVLQHVSAEGGVQDPNQVASMLEAIDSFVREAFRPQPFGVHLSRVEVGDLTIWVDRNAAAVIAAVVRGCAPRELGDVLHEAHERIYLTHRADLARFQSDVSPFAATRPILESCLQGQHRPPPRMARVWLAAAAVLLAILAGLVVASRAQHARQLRTSVEALGNEPGIVVVSADRSGGRLRIDGFRDPLAPPAADVLARHGLPPAEMGFEPFLSLDPRIVERRVRLALRPPPGVTLSVRDGTVRASGVAPRRWIEGARSLAAALPGSERFDEEDLREEETIAALQRHAALLETTQILFAPGSPQPDSITAVRRARALFDELLAAASAARLPVCVTITGYTDATGAEQDNLKLSEERAARVARELGGLAEPGSPVRAAGAGVRIDGRPPAQQRNVSFDVDMGRSCPQPR